MKKNKRQELRKLILAKYDNRCAYCGNIISPKEYQIDHLQPKAYGGTDDYENLMPSCRTCNHYKRALDLETYREVWLGELHKRLMKIYIVRVAIKYGIVTIKPFSGKFYFEEIK